ncbi:unnamed protein product [Acanthosepion pharaonis]|uniref:Uncharacterized protein n=1 Tax=Acanthosepion pharaonis TaxID=158019 RepID=A0A812AL54_ACAPH|nr:unnamed protein product [Sepia pharaonis]
MLLFLRLFLLSPLIKKFFFFDSFIPVPHFYHILFLLLLSLYHKHYLLLSNAFIFYLLSHNKIHFPLFFFLHYFFKFFFFACSSFPPILSQLLPADFLGPTLNYKPVLFQLFFHSSCPTSFSLSFATMFSFCFSSYFHLLPILYHAPVSAVILFYNLFSPSCYY